MFNLVKLFFGFVFFLAVISLAVPFFIDKQRFVKLFEEKIKSEFDANVTFNDDIGLSFLPFPTLKINSVEYFDKKRINLFIKKINISVSWSSIFDFKPEITNMEVFSPNLKFSQNQKITKDQNFIIKVNNDEQYFFDKVKKIGEKFEIVKINDGLIKFENQEYLNVSNLDVIFKGKDDLSANGKLNLDNLKSKIIFNLSNLNGNVFDLIMQQKFDGKNKLDFSGRITFFNNDFNLDGKINSEFLNFDELLLVKKQLSNFRSNKYTLTNINQKIEKKINFDIKKILIKDILLDETKFTINDFYPIIEVRNFITRFDGSEILGSSRINLKANLVTGVLEVENFKIKESYFGRTKYDLLDGKANCEIKFNYLIGKFAKNLKNFSSNGSCQTGKIKLKGIDIDKVAKNIDNIKDFSTLVNTINPKVFEGDSFFNFIRINFMVENGEFKLKKGLANHENFELSSFGKYDFLNDNISLKNKAYINTTKFKKLPPLGINIFGKLNNHKVKYDFEALKQALFNKGIEKILREKKSIIIDPGEIKKMFDKQKINPNQILDLFKN